MKFDWMVLIVISLKWGKTKVSDLETLNSCAMSEFEMLTSKYDHLLQIVALVRESRSRKSMVVALIERFYDPNSGVIYYF
jgi:ABC-type transport system involved in Fe-S cluster assembly fused permease/ATPase subunit